MNQHLTNTPRDGETVEQQMTRFLREKQGDADAVDHPPHYRAQGGMEAIDVIESFQLGFHEGNVVKYMLRWKQKGGLEDLRKARWYLDRFIEQERAKPA